METGTTRRLRVGAVAAALAMILGCTGDPERGPSPGALASVPGSTASPDSAAATGTGTATPSPPAPEPSEPATPSTTGTDRPARFSARRAQSHVRHLAGRIGPRPATGPGFRRASAWVARELRRLGYDVRRQGFRVPAGDSWGVPVDAGRSSNVVATPPGFDPARPHRLVGAHLDTVAVAPGAEDNASGVAVLLELARLARLREPRLPTVFVAFGAEEPVGPGDALHHFGSRHYVSTMPRPQRRALRAMVSLDRVGVGAVVPVCTGPLSPDGVLRSLLRTARRLGVPARGCRDNTSSDHWSFEKAGHPVGRLGSTPYAGYHSAADVPAVVSPAQLGRVGRVAWAWLRS